jgi:hypothetical protein
MCDGQVTIPVLNHHFPPHRREPNFVTELRLEKTLAAAASIRAGQWANGAEAPIRAGQGRARPAAPFRAGQGAERAARRES